MVQTDFQNEVQRKNLFYTDKKEAEALSFKRDIIDIYSMAWGPTDDGEALSGPGELAHQALEEGVNFGRDGKVSKNC